MKGIRWTEAEDDLLRHHRARRFSWDELVVPEGRTLMACIQRHSILARLARAAAAAGQPVAAARPRYFAGDNVLLLARVAAQGVTAGLLGDPPAGRSALDKKRAGLAP